MNASAHWAPLSPQAKNIDPTTALSIVNDCEAVLPSAEAAGITGFPAEQATESGSDGWHATESLIAAPDRTASGDEQALSAVYEALVSMARGCSSTVDQARVNVQTDSAGDFAATITIPASVDPATPAQSVHEYIAAPYGYVVELAVATEASSAAALSEAWDGSSPASVLKALQSGPCSVSGVC